MYFNFVPCSHWTWFMSIFYTMFSVTVRDGNISLSDSFVFKVKNNDVNSSLTQEDTISRYISYNTTYNLLKHIQQCIIEESILGRMLLHLSIFIFYWSWYHISCFKWLLLITLLLFSYFWYIRETNDIKRKYKLINRKLTHKAKTKPKKQKKNNSKLISAFNWTRKHYKISFR